MTRPDDQDFVARDSDAADLDWQAACYVWGEMDGKQQTAFERRLAEDAAACEAVARAVELSDSLAVACLPIEASHAASHERSTARETAVGNPARFRLRRIWSQRIVWMSVGAAACLAVVTAGQSWLARHGGAPISKSDVVQHDRAFYDRASSDDADNKVAPIATPPEDDDSSSLALAWTESPGWGGDFWPDAAVIEEPVGDHYRLPVLSAPSYADGQIEGESPSVMELDAPDWLLAAVASAASDGDSSDSRPPDGPPSDSSVPN